MSPRTSPPAPTAELQATIDLLCAESDRGCILVGAALIDEHLAEALSARLATAEDAKKLVEGFEAPIGDLRSRIVLARATGIISAKERSSLDSMRDMRNKAAHFDRKAHGFDVSFKLVSLQDQVASFFSSQHEAVTAIPDRSRRARAGFEKFIGEMALLLRIRAWQLPRLDELPEQPPAMETIGAVARQMMRERAAAGLAEPESLTVALDEYLRRPKTNIE